jgi:hypothetical protein
MGNSDHTILVIDDDEDIVKTIKGNFELDGYTGISHGLFEIAPADATLGIICRYPGTKEAISAVKLLFSCH